MRVAVRLPVIVYWKGPGEFVAFCPFLDRCRKSAASEVEALAAVTLAIANHLASVPMPSLPAFFKVVELDFGDENRVTDSTV